MIELNEAPRSVAACLQALGWARQSGRPPRFAIGSQSRRSVLTRRFGISGWEQWVLKSKTMPTTTASLVLRDNHSLAGPLKFFARSSSGTAACRADLPLDVLNAPEEFAVAAGQTSSPLLSWGETVTAIVRGKPLVADDPLPVQEIVQFLDSRGWVASADGPSVQVTVPLVGVFRQISIERDGSSGTRIWTELVDLAGWSTTSRRAAITLALAANERLHLVRCAMPDASGERLMLIAEIHLSTARVPGVWLAVALEAIRTAIVLTAKPLAVLSDPELAKFTLAANAARTKGELR